MRLPNGDRAVVDIAKLHGYCLSKSHPYGRHKARVFEAALGLTSLDAEDLRGYLLQAARLFDHAEPGEQDTYGSRFVLDFRMTWKGRSATVRSVWIILTAEDFPRLTSCYVL